MCTFVLCYSVWLYAHHCALRRITFDRDGVCDLMNILLKCSYACMFAYTHVAGANFCFEVYEST